MKVLLITPLPPAVGGIARWSEAYLKWSAGKFETVVVNNALLNTGASRFARYWSQVKRTLNILKDLSRQIKAGNIDIAHVNSSCAKLGIFRDYICVRMLCKNHIPVVIQCHCNIEDQLGTGKVARTFFKKTVALAAKTLVLNTTSLNFAMANGAKNVTVCPNFIAKEKIADAPHEISQEMKTAMYVGHLYKDKGVEMILELAKQHPNMQFRLVGPFTKEYNDQTVSSANVVLTGAKDASGVMEELDAADLFLLLSYSEGFSNAMLEAMARGVPIIASDAGAASDMIGEQGGIIVPRGDMAGASAAIDTLSSAALRAKMSEYNRAKAATHYETNTVLNTIMRYYMEIKNG